ncbi:MAG: protein kinase [Polyangiaceae bacterium]|nr:protein kinase [Polyangiaceae bacterium]MCW5791539.1 protein kinase [Polyangiaceae bacterium]
MSEIQIQPSPQGAGAAGAHVTHRCPGCGHQFSGDARFCPFDGSRLEQGAPWDPSADPLLGQRIDQRYQVEAVLGEGGMGTVYRVRHATLGRYFALKVLKKELAGEADLSARFIREAKAAASVSHPNVVQITDFGRIDNGQPYFVMEMLEGRSLGWLIHHGGSIPAARAVRILRQVAEALAAAHAQGVVHRDLKPDNIHIGDAVGAQGDLVKVLDFGLAKVAGASRLTRQGMVFGTPHYMSPEQAAGEATDHRADIYALGVVMYEVFTGRVPFEADTYMGVLTKHLFVAPTPPSEVVPSARELGGLEEITLRCLEKKAAQRFQSMGEFIEELDRVVSLGDDGSLRVRSSTGARPAAPPHKNLLADELEPPSPEEIRLERRRPRHQPTHRAAWLRVGLPLAATSLVVLGLGAWAFWPTSAGLGEELVNSAGQAPQAPGEAAPAVAPTPPVAQTVPVNPPAPAASAVVTPTPAPVAAPAIIVPRAPDVQRAGSSAAPKPKPAPATPAASPAPAPKPIGGGEVIDPWN